MSKSIFIRQCVISCILGLLSLSAAYALVDDSELQGYIKSYTRQEMREIEQDLEAIRSRLFNGKTPVTDSQPLYLATCGGPGASKSTIMISVLKGKKYKDVLPHYTNMVEIDPDQILQYMLMYTVRKTHYDPDEDGSYQTFLENLYKLCRGASNYIANTLLNEAGAGRYNIAQPRTSTSEGTSELCRRLQASTYSIHFSLCGSTDENRVKAIEYRAKVQASVQADSQDVIDKGKMFPLRFPVYFQFADQMAIFWTEVFSEGSALAGVYTKKSDQVKALNETAWKSFKDFYLPKIKEIQGGENSVDKYFER